MKMIHRESCIRKTGQKEKKWHLQGRLSHLKTATSFLNACSCSGVGLVTFKIFTATSPATQKLCSHAFSHIQHTVRSHVKQCSVHTGSLIIWHDSWLKRDYKWKCPALSETHSYHAISLCTQFQRSLNRCESADTPHWPQFPSSSWSPSCPEASGWIDTKKRCSCWVTGKWIIKWWECFLQTKCGNATFGLGALCLWHIQSLCILTVCAFIQWF